LLLFGLSCFIEFKSFSSFLRRFNLAQIHSHREAAGELANLAIAGTPGRKPTPQQSCVAKCIKGDANSLLPPGLAHVPEPFILEEHLPKLLEGLNPDEAAPEVEEASGVEWLPDVSLSNVGMKRFCNAYQVCSR
jgi:hypothetical protein